MPAISPRLTRRAAAFLGAVSSVAAASLLAASPASAQPVTVFQQSAQAVGAIPQPQLLGLGTPAVLSFGVAAQQDGPGAVRLWIAERDAPCTSSASEVIVAWGNITTGAAGAERLASCVQAPGAREAVVQTGPGEIHFQTLVSGAGRVELGSSGSVGPAPGAPYLDGNGAFSVN